MCKVIRQTIPACDSTHNTKSWRWQLGGCLNVSGRPRLRLSAGTNEKARTSAGFFIRGVPDDDLLSHGSSVLSSACCRFTVLFGMGRRGSSRLLSSGVAVVSGQLAVVSNDKSKPATEQKVRVGLSRIHWRGASDQQASDSRCLISDT